MARANKTEPKISSEVLILHDLVEAVRNADVVARSGKDYAHEALYTVAAMIEVILLGGAPDAVLGLGDRRKLNTLFSPWHRDQVLALMVAEARATGAAPSIESAVAAVADRTGAGEQVVRDAYYEHREFAATALADLERIRERVRAEYLGEPHSQK